MSKFISDEEMSQLEAQSATKPSNFISDEDMAKMEASQPSELDSAGRGFVQGASMGFADEIAGAGQGIWNDLKNVFTGNIPEVKLEKDELGRYTPETIARMNESATYDKFRDEYRQADKLAEEANPKSYLAGQVGGAVGTGLLTGGGASLGRLAAQGAVAGLGNSEAENLAGMAKDTAIGAGVGAITHGTGKALASGASKLGSAAKNTLEDIATAPMGQEGIKNAGLAARALNKTGQIGEKVANVAKTVDDKIGGMYTSAREASVGDLGNELLNKGADQAARRSAYSIPGVGKGLLAVDATVAGSRAAGNIAKAVPGLAQKGAIMSVENLPKLMPHLGKFGPTLQKAAERGGTSLAATHFVLQQQNPEYQSLIREVEGMDE